MDALSEAIVRLLRKHETLDQRLARVEAALNLQPVIPETPPRSVPETRATIDAAAMTPSLPEAPREVPPPTTPPLLPVPQAPRALETNIGLTLVNRIGVVTLVLGVAFFFKW